MNYFEGWYYKLITKDKSYALSVIPGISIAHRKPRCFIQFIDSTHALPAYTEFPADCFYASGHTLSVQIGENIFRQDEMRLNIDKDGFKIYGVLCFYNIVPFPKTGMFRGIMGPFSFIPFMECNHAIVNIRHSISGSLTINGKRLDFEQGAGYIEKDWGTSFPDSWIWLQAHSPDGRATFMFSAADIPFLGRRFLGVLCFLYLNGQYHSASTYNGIKIKYYHIEQDRATIYLYNNKYSVSVDIQKKKGASLKAPVKGMMRREIEETLNAEVTIDFSQCGAPLFKGTLNHAGLEICGDVKAMFHRHLHF